MLDMRLIEAVDIFGDAGCGSLCSQNCIKREDDVSVFIGSPNQTQALGSQN